MDSRDFQDDPLGQITRILAAAGDRNPMDTLMPMVHADLRRLARAQRSRMNSGETLSTTALVNEAYLKLRRADATTLNNREHFFSLVARAMRQILIDHARSRLAERRRMDFVRIELEDRSELDAVDLQRLLEVDSAVTALEEVDPRLAQVVLYRYFAGYSAQETAALIGVTERTVNRDWHKARAWLNLALDPGGQGAAGEDPAGSDGTPDPA